MQTLQLALSESQYERLQREAEERCTSMNDLLREAVEAFLRAAVAERRYARLARKQAVWRTRQGVEPRSQPGLPGGWPLREQPATYRAESGRNIHARLADLRLDLVYHSEALEGSPLTRVQVEDAIRELSPR